MKEIRIIYYSIIANTIVSLILIFLVGGYTYWHRDAIFGSFADRYYQVNKNGAGDSGKDANFKIVNSENSVESVVAKVNPAVVSIIASKDMPVWEQYYEQGNPFGDFFNFNIPQYRQNGTEKREIGSGSGFFVSADGTIITNKHVVTDTGAQYTVVTKDNQKYEAKVLARDLNLDIAVLKIDKKDMPFLELGDSEKLKLGQSVVAIGNALGEFRNSVSVGVISGLSRSITAGTGSGQLENLEQVIQTDAAINPGNSGGPLLDLSGRVIGVNVAVAQGSENIGFALPINSVKNIVSSVAKYGEIVRPYLGIRYVQIDSNLQKKNNLSVDYGVLITRGNTPDELAVVPGSPADKAGLLENDIILSIDGQKLDGSQSLALLVREKQIGQELKLKVLSKGQEKEVKVKLEKAPNK